MIIVTLFLLCTSLKVQPTLQLPQNTTTINLAKSTKLEQERISKLPPQVHEEVDESDLHPRTTRQEGNNNRIRGPKNHYQPPAFDPQSALQQDHRQNRYAQQQKVDLQNIQKAKTGRTLNQHLPTSHFNFNGNFKAKRHSLEDYDNLDDLKGLIGKSPDDQLEGLQQLLKLNQPILPPISGKIKDHTPITEKILDVAPSLMMSNRNSYDHSNYLFENLQMQFDSLAQKQAQEVLERAQKEAEEHVRAQERAIARAQVEAQKAAYAEIEARNQPDAVVVLQKEKVTVTQVTNNQKIDEGVERPSGEYHSLPLVTRVVRPNAKLVLADADFYNNGGEQETPVDQYAANYAFGYRIRDAKMGNEFGHQEEKRDGKTVKGHYHVLLPDGRLQRVEYYADETGYHAKVSYENVGVR